ncbi:MAG TPA: hypothetical protein VFH88_15540 [Candidatus Krumholzibacteria bacterium]|nr:hypothetical protein [Candidatus Krumholzibacteria bacterium]
MNVLVYIVGFFVLSLIARAFRTRAIKFSSPPRIQLFHTAVSGQHGKDLAARKAELDGCGLKRIGTYRIDPLNVMASAFVNEQESICAVVYHHPVVGCFVDVVSKNTAGKSFTATNAPTGGALDHREGQEKVFDKSKSISELFELTKQRRPEGPYETWTPENFIKKFETAYAEDMDWRARRGGVTKEEVRRQAQASGKVYSEDVIDKATSTLQKKFAESRQDVR